jgi:hypothetical protein
VVLVGVGMVDCCGGGGGGDGVVVVVVVMLVGLAEGDLVPRFYLNNAASGTSSFLDKFRI